MCNVNLPLKLPEHVCQEQNVDAKHSTQLEMCLSVEMENSHKQMLK